MNGVTSLEPRIAALESGVAAISAQVSRLADALEHRSKPNYALLVSVISLVVALAGGVFSVLSKDIAYVNREQKEAEARMMKSIDAMDTKLQQEYRLVNETVRSEVKAVNDASRERFDLNQRDVIRLNAEITRLSSRLYGAQKE
jgi:hypothetical protein